MLLKKLDKVYGGVFFTYGCDGDYTPKFYLCPSSGFPNLTMQRYEEFLEYPNNFS